MDYAEFYKLFEADEHCIGPFVGLGLTPRFHQWTSFNYVSAFLNRDYAGGC
jgi:hypothetical protein